MAFNDIENWARILENQESEEKAWDKACDEANAKVESDEVDEISEYDEDVVEMCDMGITEKEEEDAVQEEDEFDETIDFSKYRLNPLTEEDEDEKKDAEKVQEADTRELLTRIATALEKSAGTANLVT